MHYFVSHSSPLRRVFPDFLYYAWSPVSNEVQEGVDKIWRAVGSRWKVFKVKGNGKGGDDGGDRVRGGEGSRDGGKGGVGGLPRETIVRAEGEGGAGRAAALDRSWRWSAVNTTFAVVLTTVGVAFTVVQLRCLAGAQDRLTRAHAEEEESKRERRLLLVRERAALRRLET